MAQVLSPLSYLNELDANGVPRAGAKLFTYLAGTSTKTTTTQDSAGAVNHTNPIILNSRGEPASGAGARTAIWHTAGQTLKYVLAPSNDTDPPAAAIWSIDNVPGMNDITTPTVSQWQTGTTPTFVSSTSLTLAGDQTSTYHIGRRVRTVNSGGTIYSTITASAFTTVTTLTLANDSGSLDAGLSTIEYGLTSAVNNSVPGGAHFAPTQFQSLIHFVAGLGPNYAQNWRIVPSVASNALTLALKGNDGNDPTAANAVHLTFRNVTLTNGSYVIRAVTAAKSVVIPSGATLGFVTAEDAEVDVFAIDSDGTVELAVAGKGYYFDPGNVVSTTAISSGADSAGTLYSTTARSNVPMLRLGRVKVQTGATPGEWSNAPTIATFSSRTGPSVNFQQFTASGTWIKPGDFPTTGRVLIEAWGGGGSGASSTSGGTAAGGGGGGYSFVWKNISSLGATETVTVAAGGAAVGNGSGNPGGSSSFGSHLTVYGGSGADISTVASTGGGFFATGDAASYGGALFGGGAGSIGAGGNSVYGGAAGGSETPEAGGQSKYAGAGGAGIGIGTATSGSAPAGGGGGSGNGTSGAGARGEVRVTCFP